MERTQLPPPHRANETGQGNGDEPQGAATTRQRRGSFTAENLALENQVNDLNLQIEQYKKELEEEKEETKNLSLIVEEKGRRLAEVEHELKSEVEARRQKLI